MFMTAPSLMRVSRKSTSFRAIGFSKLILCSRGQYAQDIFTFRTAYFEGKPPKSVNMYWRRFALSSIPLDDPKAFEVWLRARWMEKDALIEAYYQHGRFPADRGAHKTPEGKIIRGAGHIETEVKSNYWFEFLQIFAPVGLLAMVLYMFYNALPQKFTEQITKENMMKKAEELQKQNLAESSKVPASQDSLLAKMMAVYSDLSKNEAIQQLVQLPELSQKGLKDEVQKLQPDIDTILTQKNALQDLKPKKPATRPPNSSGHPVNTRAVSTRTASITSQGASIAPSSTRAKNGSIAKKSVVEGPKRIAPKLAPSSKANSVISQSSAVQTGQTKPVQLQPVQSRKASQALPAKSISAAPSVASSGPPKFAVKKPAAPKLASGKSVAQPAGTQKPQANGSPLKPKAAAVPKLGAK
jgi:Acyltransferase C-terminus